MPTYDVFDVDSYGADPTGVDESQTALNNAAADAAVARGGQVGGILQLGIGTYKLTAAASIWRADGIILRGLGAGTVVQVAFAGPGLTGDGTRRLRCGLEDLFIAGSYSGGPAQDLVELNNLDSFVACRVTVQDCTDRGFYVWSPLDGGATRNEFIAVSCLGCGTGIKFAPISNSARVIGGHFQGNGVGIDIVDKPAPNAFTAPNNMLVAGAIIESVDASAKGLQTKGESTTAMGCRFEFSGDNSVGISIASPATKATTTGNYYSISGTGTVDISDGGEASLLLDRLTKPDSPTQSPRYVFDEIKDATGTYLDTLMRLKGIVTLLAGWNDEMSGGIDLDPTYDGAHTVARHNYLNLRNPTLSGGAAVTNAALARFDQPAGTHKAVDGQTTKVTPGTVNAWIKVNINGTIHYMPAYLSKTS